MSDFNALKFVADNAGLNIFKALEKAYEQGVADAAPKWIPVTTNPPNEEKSYLVWLDCGSVCDCRWTDGDYLFGKPTGVWRWNFIDIPKHTKILAWMPLPEPWKGEE